MIERIVDHENYLVRLPANPKSEDAILFLHGFPSNKGVKNLDVALYARDELNRDVFIVHYKGLGESVGDFLYTTAIRETIDLVEWLVQKKGYKKIQLVGHSFGGLVAVNCAIAHPDLIGSILLISPFCHMVTTEPLYRWFTEDVRTESPEIFRDRPKQEVKADVDQVLAKHLPLDLAPDVSEQIKIAILQSKGDNVTPASTTKQFAARLKRAPVYEELDQDHGFAQDRMEFSRAINRLLADLTHE